MKFRNPFKKKRITVGWLIAPRKGRVIYYPPELVTPDVINDGFKGTQMYHDLENSCARYFLMRCPLDINVSFYKDKKGKWGIRSHAGNNYAIDMRTLQRIMFFSSPPQWRHPDRPLVQIQTPYRFVSDDYVYINQHPPFPYYLDQQWPGVFVSGRFPIYVWPRIFMWAIEVHDLEKPLILKRGDPWFIARFESADPEGVIEVVEAQSNRELEEYFTQVDGVTGYVNQTFSLFKTSALRRPKQVLIERHDNQ